MSKYLNIMYNSVTLIDQDICKVQARSGKLQQVPWQSGLEEAEDEEAATCARWGKCAQATVTHACRVCTPSAVTFCPDGYTTQPAPAMHSHLPSPACSSPALTFAASTVSAPSEGAPVSFVPGSSPRAQNTSPQLVNVQ